VSGEGEDAANGGPDWWQLLQVPELVRELEEAGTASEWNGTIASFVHYMLMVFMGQHPNHDSARDAIGEKLLNLIARGFVPPPHRARRLHRARFDAALCRGCRTQTEAVAVLMSVGLPIKNAQGRSYRMPTASEARSRVRAAMKYGGLKLGRAPRGGARKRKA
jgi:hypothetical protein